MNATVADDYIYIYIYIKISLLQTCIEDAR